MPCWTKFPDDALRPINNWYNSKIAEIANYKSNFAFECEDLGKVGFYTIVDILYKSKNSQNFEIIDAALCWSQKSTVDSLYNDAYVLAIQFGF